MEQEACNTAVAESPAETIRQNNAVGSVLNTVAQQDASVQRGMAQVTLERAIVEAMHLASGVSENAAQSLVVAFNHSKDVSNSCVLVCSSCSLACVRTVKWLSGNSLPLTLICVVGAATCTKVLAASFLRSEYECR